MSLWSFKLVWKPVVCIMCRQQTEVLHSSVEQLEQLVMQAAAVRESQAAAAVAAERDTHSR